MELVISIVVSALILGLMFLYFRRQLKQATSASSFLKDLQDEVDEMVKELNLSAERNIALLEDRISTLETLLTQADEKIVKMTRELEKKEKSAGVYNHLKKSNPEFAAKQNELPIETPADRAQPNPVRPESPAKPQPAAELVGVSVLPAVDKTRPLKERVLELARFGMPASEIASKTGATLGEVELIVLLGSPRSETARS